MLLAAVLQFPLGLVADAVRFVFHLLRWCDCIFCSLRLCFAPYMLDAELSLSCDSRCYIIDCKSVKKESRPTQLSDERGSAAVARLSLLPCAQRYLHFAKQ